MAAIEQGHRHLPGIAAGRLACIMRPWECRPAARSSVILLWSPGWIRHRDGQEAIMDSLLQSIRHELLIPSRGNLGRYNAGRVQRSLFAAVSTQAFAKQSQKCFIEIIKFMSLQRYPYLLNAPPFRHMLARRKYEDNFRYDFGGSSSVGRACKSGQCREFSSEFSCFREELCPIWNDGFRI